MRRIAVVAMLAALILPTTLGQSHTSTVAAANEPKCATVKHYRYILVHKVIRFSHTGGNFVAYKIKNRGERRLQRMKKCVREDGGTHRLDLMREWTQHRRHEWHRHHYIDTITIYGQWVIPYSAVMNESGGYRFAVNGIYKGWYQVGVDHHNPGRVCYGLAVWHAAAQHICAYRVLRSEGPGAWKQTW